MAGRELEPVSAQGDPLNGENEPVIFARLEGSLLFSEPEYRLLKDILVAFIDEAGLLEFGVGLSQRIVDALKDNFDGHLAAPATKTAHPDTHVFLSYARENQNDVSRLRERLMAAIQATPATTKEQPPPSVLDIGS